MTEWMLEASPRDGRGKGPARQLRRAGMVPAIVYGRQEPLAVKVSEHDVSRLVQKLHGVTRVVTLRLPANGGKADERPVLIKEVQTTAVGGHLLHIDFNEIDTTKTVHASVEIRPVGHAVGVTLGGTLQTVSHEIVVECLPFDIPEAIEVDVTTLGIGKSVHVKDLKLPAGVKAVTDADNTVLVVSGAMKEEVEVAPVEEAAAAAVPAEGEAAPGEVAKPAAAAPEKKE
jgi:large subunit ribosomal protein L25